MKFESNQVKAITIELTDDCHLRLKQEALRLHSTQSRLALALLLNQVWQGANAVGIKEREYQQLATCLFHLFLRLFSLWMACDRMAIENPDGGRARELAQLQRRRFQELVLLTRSLLDILLGISAGRLQNFDAYLIDDLKMAARIVTNVFRNLSLGGTSEKHTRALADYLVLLSIVTNPNTQPKGD